jgi:hypothetical protein
MHHAGRTVWVLFALLFLTQASFAGPIGWGYHVEVSDGAGGSWAYFGTDTQSWYDPATGQEGQTPYLVLGNIGASVWGESAGSDTLHVLSVGQSQLRGVPVDDSATGIRTSSWEESHSNIFWMDVTITDQASGQSRDLRYAAGGTGFLFAATGTGVVSLWAEDKADGFVLGTNRYTVRPVARESESAGHLELEVAVVANPEPGTLALAGAAIGVVGLARVVRRGRR